MTHLKRFAVAGLLAATTFAVPAIADEFSPAQKLEVEQILRDYLLQHPELLQDMAKLLEEKQQAAQAELQASALVKNGPSIFRSKGDFVTGNPAGDVTMVEFFDYNCGWCKRGFPEVIGLLKKDKQLRLVLKEFPIFGEDSEYAARAALASHKQNKYWELHTALFSHEGKVTKETVDAAARKLGLDMDKLTADMASDETNATIQQNQALAQELAINGTPAFIIGKKVVPGYLPQAELAQTINSTRKDGTCNNLC